MKKIVYSSLIAYALLWGCQNGVNERTYLPRPIAPSEDFNNYTKDNSEPFVLVKAQGDNPELFAVKFRDTLVKIQSSADDKDFVVDKFSLTQFVNTQKTALLVQQAAEPGLVGPFYLLTVKNDQLDIVSLYRPSTGKEDQKYTQGLARVGSQGYLINNDFFLTNVNAKLYEIRRQNPEERIQGEFMVMSPDKKTFVFLTSSALYEIHYPSGQSFTQSLPAAVPPTKGEVFRWIQNNFNWQKNKNGISFLTANADDNRIVDLSEFKR